MRFGVCAAGTFGAAVRSKWHAVLGNVVWTGSVRGCLRISDLAAVYVPLSACGRAAHSVQPSVSGDVRSGFGADVGEAEILYLFLPVWSGRGNHQRDCEADDR